MQSKKKTLGKGLDEIFGGDVQSVIDNISEERTDGTVFEIEMSKLTSNPYQPRKEFDKKEIQGLSESIKENGLFTPILVRKNKDGNFYIVTGERRFKASKLIGNKTIKAIIAKLSDEEMQRIALVENVQREDLNPIEVASSIKLMSENQNLKHDEIAKIIGKSRSYVVNLLGLLKLDQEIVNGVSKGQISYGHARSLITLPKKDSLVVFEKIIAQKLSVRETETIVKNIKEKTSNHKDDLKKTKAQEIIYAEELMRVKLKTKISISKKEIVIKYQGKGQLSELLKQMGFYKK